MIIDLSKSRADIQKIEADICIVGSGPAGISLALDLIGSGKTVCLLEAGGRRAPAINATHPYQGVNSGRPYSMSTTRLRFLGGSSNHWGGWCRPLDPIDFRQKEYAPLSGWPISRRDLNPYYNRALEICEVDTGGIGLEGFDQTFGATRAFVEQSDKLVSKNFFFSPPTRFGQRYEKELDNADNITCYLNATVTNIVTSSGNIIELGGLTSELENFSVQAGSYVLAMGAIENARLLLANDIDSGHPYLGSCFSDHTGRTPSIVVTDSSNRFRMYNEQEMGGTRVFPHLSFKEDYLEENGCLNFGATLEVGSKIDESSASVSSLVSLQRKQPMGVFRMLFRIENLPNPESTVSLSNSKDAYGMPRVNLNWISRREDYESLLRAARLMEREFLTKGFGRFKSRNLTVDSMLTNATYQAHHMGTTRMSPDPAKGIVDSNLKMHSQENLFVLGSSVFPSFGFANPTLTIVALAARLAEHLKNPRAAHEA